MTDKLKVQQEVQGGGVTLGHLLLAIAFVSPIAAVAIETHHAAAEFYGMRWAFPSLLH